MQEEDYTAEDFLRETNMIQHYDNATGDCTSAFCDGKRELVTGNIIHPCDPECWFERVGRFLKRKGGSH